jgi:hypothetical protein
MKEICSIVHPLNFCLYGRGPPSIAINPRPAAPMPAPLLPPAASSVSTPRAPCHVVPSRDLSLLSFLRFYFFPSYFFLLGHDLHVVLVSVVHRSNKHHKAFESDAPNSVVSFRCGIDFRASSCIQPLSQPQHAACGIHRRCRAVTSRPH